MKQARVTTRVTISATPTEVFAYLEDLNLHYLWNPHTLKISPVSMLKKGAKYTSDNRVLGVRIRAHNVITKFVRNKELEIRNDTGIVQYTAVFQLLPKGNKTQVVCTTNATTDSKTFAFTVPVLNQLARRELQTDLQALKLAVEHKLQ